MGVVFSFGIFGIVFAVIFLAAAGFIIYTISKNVSQTVKNNNSPVLTVNAKIVAKRTHVGNHMQNNNDMMYNNTYTKYYSTFEFESKDRLELLVPRDKYGYIVEGDNGKLTFQGTRFIDFERA